MGYIQLNLADGERIVYRTRLHWIIFIWPLLFLLLTYGAFVGGFNVMRQVFQALALITVLWVPITYLLSEFAVTNRRVMGRLGPRIYIPVYDEVSLIEIREIEFKPGILGGLFDYGMVVITDRQDAKHKFSIVPVEFYKQVQARDARVRRVLR